MAYIGPPPPGHNPGQSPGDPTATPPKRGSRLTWIKKNIKYKLASAKVSKNKAKQAPPGAEPQIAAEATALAPIMAPASNFTPVLTSIPVPMPPPVPMPLIIAPPTQAFHYPMPPYPMPVAPGSVIITTTTVTTTQHDLAASQAAPPPAPQVFQLSASQPATVTGGVVADWKERMSQCVVELLTRLHDGNEDEVASGFALLQKIARERKFSGDELDGLIAAALKDCTLEHLDRIDTIAKALLPQGMLADSMRLGIARRLLPLKFVEAVKLKKEPELWSIAKDLRKCCNPANWKEPQPTEEVAKFIILKMLERVLDRLPPKDLLQLSRTAPYSKDDPAIRALNALLGGKYARPIADAETNI